MNGRHAEFEELQDYREGLLPPGRQDEIRAHLEDCAACREELAALDRLLADLSHLPREATPSKDLWPQIEWRTVGKNAPAPPARASSGITLRAWQLLAASLAVALFSGGMVWAVLSGGSGGDEVAYGPPPATVLPVGLEGAYEGYREASRELEAIIEKGREVLDPETLQVLEENLKVIDDAIAESREALAQDPGSQVLRRVLSETLRRRMDLLLQAAEAIYANS